MKLVRHRRTKGWRKPPNTRSIMRNTIYGNLFKVSDHGAERAVWYFAEWLAGRVHPPRMPRGESDRRREVLLDRLDELRQFECLMCCSEWDGISSPPPFCHGVILIWRLEGKIYGPS